MSLFKVAASVVGLGLVVTVIGVSIHSLSSSQTSEISQLKKLTSREKAKNMGHIPLSFDDASDDRYWKSNFDRYKVEKSRRDVSIEQFKSGCKKLFDSEESNNNVFLIWNWCSRMSYETETQDTEIEDQ